MYYIENKELSLIDPQKFGLSLRTVLGQYFNNHMVLIKNRKSRIIMKDGRQIFKQIQQIQDHNPNLKTSFATNAPACSKTTTFLKEKGIEILSFKKHS